MLEKIRKLNYWLMSLVFLLISGGLILFYYLDQKERNWIENYSFSLADYTSSKEKVQGIMTNENNIENYAKKESQILIESFSQEEINQKEEENLFEQEKNLKEREEQQNQNEIDSKPEKEKFSFIIIGDAEDYETDFGYSEKLPLALQKAASLEADFAIFTGDIITTAKPIVADNKQSIEKTKSLLDSYFKKYYLVFGGHDIECGRICIDYWLKTFFNQEIKVEEDRKLFHSFDFGNTHFVLLSSEYPQNNSIDEKQLIWLENDLANCQKTNKIVVSHVPPVTFFEESAEEGHDMSKNSFSQARLLKILKEHQVDLVISGHEHVFDHKIVEGIDFILAGSVGQKARYKNIIKGDIITYIKIDKERILLYSFKVNGEKVRDIIIK